MQTLQAAFWKTIFWPDQGYKLSLATISHPTDRYGLHDSARVEEIQGELVEVLKREVTRRDWKNKQLFARLLMQVTSVRVVSMLFNKCANNFRRAWPHIQIPALLSEILDYEY